MGEQVDAAAEPGRLLDEVDALEVAGEAKDGWGGHDGTPLKRMGRLGWARPISTTRA
ncbi:hypothetical protein D3C86_2160060 [compost metagenome]